MNKKTLCCVITPNGRCKKEAEFEITYGNEVSDVCESCASHIGEVVNMGDSRGRIVGRFVGIRIEEKEECSICHGEGSTTDHHDPCSNCGGEGYIT